MRNRKDVLCPQDLLNDISDLVPHLGANTFDRQFYETCRRMFRNDQCNVFVFNRDMKARPHCAFSTASESDIRDVTLAATEEYVASGYLSDPTLKWAQHHGLNDKTSQARIVSPQQIANQSYRLRFYDRAFVRQKMALVFCAEGLTVYLNFYRNSDQEDFNNFDRKNLDLFGGMLGRLFHKHLRMNKSQAPSASPMAFDINQNNRENLLERMREVFLENEAGLTPRESDVCAAIAIGMTGIGIGLELGISLNTVATHRKRAYAKLGISSQSELFLRHHEIVARQMVNLQRH